MTRQWSSNMNRQHKRGLVLVIVLVLIAVLSLAAFTFAELMLTEHRSAQMEARKAQARALVESGAEMLRVYLAQAPSVLQQTGGTYDNATQFQSIEVTNDGTPRGTGRYSI